jgi:hypothetical protein
VGFAKVSLAFGRGPAGLPINDEAAALASAVGFAKVGLVSGLSLAGLAIKDEAASRGHLRRAVWRINIQTCDLFVKIFPGTILFSDVPTVARST